MDSLTSRSNGRCRTLIVAIVVVLVAGVVPGGQPASSGAPTEELDLAALLIHSDDLDWLVQEKIRGTAENTPYGAQFSAGLTDVEGALSADPYAYGRGGFTLGEMPSEVALDTLEETGWARSQETLMLLPDSFDEEAWTYGVAATIEEFDTAEGAAEAFDTFNDINVLDDVAMSLDISTVEPAEARGDDQAMWRLDSTRFDGVTVILTYWVRVDNLIVSVALLDATRVTEPEPATLETLMTLQLKRIEMAEFLYQPHLTACAPRLEAGLTGMLRDEYTVLNGYALPVFAQDFDALADDQEMMEAEGRVDSYYVSQDVYLPGVGAFDGYLFFRGDRRSFIDEDHASEYLASREDALVETPDYEDVEAVTDAPEIGDESAAFTYTDASGNAATVMHVRSGSEVISVRLGSMQQSQPEAVFVLAEAGLERLESGACDAGIPLPDELSRDS